MLNTKSQHDIPYSTPFNEYYTQNPCIDIPFTMSNLYGKIQFFQKYYKIAYTMSKWLLYTLCIAETCKINFVCVYNER